MGSKGGCGGVHILCVVCGGECCVGCVWYVLCVMWGVIGLYGVVGVWGVHPMWGVWELCSVCGRGVLAVDCECVICTHSNMACCSCAAHHSFSPVFCSLLSLGNSPKQTCPTHTCIHMHTRTCVQAHAHACTLPFLASVSFPSFFL